MKYKFSTKNSSGKFKQKIRLGRVRESRFLEMADPVSISIVQHCVAVTKVSSAKMSRRLTLFRRRSLSRSAQQTQ